MCGLLCVILPVISLAACTKEREVSQKQCEELERKLLSSKGDLRTEDEPLQECAELERKTQEFREEMRERDEAPLIAEAKTAVLRSLRDPGSAEFGRVEVRYCKDLDCNDDPAHGKPMVCGSVNAKDGFGGYTGFQVFIYGNGTLIPPKAVAENTALAGKICL